MGSVKDIQILAEPTKEKMGHGRFLFSDRYSVFDWGTMPDEISDKGKALCLSAAYFFEQAIREGINTHYQGVVSENGEVCNVRELTQPTRTMEVSLVRVIHPSFQNGAYDYSSFSEFPANILVPLEFIYRNGLPEGSSVFKRLANSTTTLTELGLDHAPIPGEKLHTPLVDVSTKLEREDRYLSWREAQQIAGLLESEANAARALLLKLNNLITRAAQRIGVENEDGKIELAFNPWRHLMVVDVFGTLDECRYTLDGVHLSKEAARQFYKTTPWHDAVTCAKEEAKQQKDSDWKKYCSLQPEPLPPTLKEIISQMYTATTNAILEQKIFDVPPLDEVIRRYKGWLTQ